MSLAEKVSLTPFEKYMRFSRFPWRMVFHLVLVALVTAEAQAALNLIQKHNRILEEQFAKLFLGIDEGEFETQLYDVGDFQASIGQVFWSVSQLKDQLFQKVNTDSIEASL